MLSLILLIAAFILFAIAGLGIASGKFNLAALGLACWALSALVSRYQL